MLTFPAPATLSRADLYSPLRWNLWRQLRHERPRATTLTSDLHLLAPLAKCGNRAFFRNGTASMNLIVEYLRDQCERYFCMDPFSKAGGPEHEHNVTRAATYRLDVRSGPPFCNVAAMRADTELDVRRRCREKWPDLDSVAWVVGIMNRYCDTPPLRHYNMTAELAAAGDDALTPVRFGLDEYMRLAFSHKFCLVSHGDDATTHKLAESIAIAGLGGCLPLIVHTRPHAVHLPYVRHVNYCSVAMMVNGSADGQPAMSMRDVLDRLATVSADEAARRQQAAAALRPAFVQREGATLETPSAAHYIVAAMCARAARVRGAKLGAKNGCEQGVKAVEAAKAELALDPFSGRTPPTCLPPLNTPPA